MFQAERVKHLEHRGTWSGDVQLVVTIVFIRLAACTKCFAFSRWNKDGTHCSPVLTESVAAPIHIVFLIASKTSASAGRNRLSDWTL